MKFATNQKPSRFYYIAPQYFQQVLVLHSPPCVSTGNVPCVVIRELLDALHLNEEPRRVLVVEDHILFCRRLREWLLEMGHEVIALRGVDKEESGKLTGPNPEGEDTEVALDWPQAVFLDHFFLGSLHTGTSLTQALRAVSDVPIVGMSSDRGANHSMVQAGAKVAVLKHELRRMIGDF